MKLNIQLPILGAIGAVLSFAMPAHAQTPGPCEPGGACPNVELSGGDVTCADAIAMIPSFPNGPRANLKYVELLIENPASQNPKNTLSPAEVDDLPADFAVDLLQSMTDSNVFTVTEASSPHEGESSQITDLPGFEVVIMQRNNSAVAYYTNNIRSGEFAAPGTQTPNKIRVCWAVGPCGLDSQGQVNTIAGIYNSDPDSATWIDDLQAQRSTHFGEAPNPINVCSLTGIARYCNTSIAPGEAGSCVPEGFAGSGTTSVITSGTNSSRFYSSGGGDSDVSSSDSEPTSCETNLWGLCL